MRAKLGLWVLAVSFFLGGCAGSLRQVAPEKDCVFDPSVLGSWTATDEDGQTTTIRVNKKDADSYLIVGISPEPDYQVTYLVKLFRLGTTLFYDVAPHHVSVKGENVDIDELDVYPRHSLGKIRIQQDEMRIAGLDGQWVKRALDEKKVNLKFESMSAGIWDDILLTGPPEEIRAFLEKYADDKGAFPDELVIKRQK